MTPYRIDYKDYFSKHIGCKGVYVTGDGRSELKRPIEIIGVYDHFVRLAVINYDGKRQYEECSNYFSLDDGEDNILLALQNEEEMKCQTG